MTVLNRTNDGLFNVLIILVRALVRFGPQGRDQLILACGGEYFTEENNQLPRRSPVGRSWACLASKMAR